ncbi:MAG: hypothetical protein M3Q10_19885 [Chloroflexota bacterium]|nr:hypothetical protein [Chloroflexota bacterium]
MTDRRPSDPNGDADKETYALLDELDRLEELIEEMDALGVSSRSEAEQRLAELNVRVDGLSDG